MSEAPTHPVSINHQNSFEGTEEVDIHALLSPLKRRWKLLLIAPVLGAAVGIAGSYLIRPTFTSVTTLLPPQQQQSAAASALASLGGLASLAGGAAGIKSPADQYISLLQSARVSDRIIDQFKLMQAYETPYRFRARKTLASNVQISAGKKDGIITIQVDDHDKDRAAAMANAYVLELSRLTSELAVTEAQVRRVFFEKQLQKEKDSLAAAQISLQQSGFNGNAIRTEPKASAEAYASLRAQLTAAEVKLSALRTNLTEGAVEIRNQSAIVSSLRQQLGQVESNAAPAGKDADYITKFRDYKYHETLFDLLAKQYELAKIDESHEGSLVQVIDVAQPAELKSAPKRSIFALAGFIVVPLVLSGLILFRQRKTASPTNPRSPA